jgi:hypothetical protein
MHICWRMMRMHIDLKKCPFFWLLLGSTLHVKFFPTMTEFDIVLILIVLQGVWPMHVINQVMYVICGIFTFFTYYHCFCLDRNSDKIFHHFGNISLSLQYVHSFCKQIDSFVLFSLLFKKKSIFCLKIIILLLEESFKLNNNFLLLKSLFCRLYFTSCGISLFCRLYFTSCGISLSFLSLVLHLLFFWAV